MNGGFYLHNKNIPKELREEKKYRKDPETLYSLR